MITSNARETQPWTQRRRRVAPWASAVNNEQQGPRGAASSCTPNVRRHIAGAQAGGTRRSTSRATRRPSRASSARRPAAPSRTRQARPCGRTRPRRTASRRTSAAASGRGAVGTLPNPLNTERTKACTRAPSQTETAAALRRLSFVHAAERSHHCLLATGNWQALWKLGTGSSRLTQWNEAQT